MRPHTALIIAELAVIFAGSSAKADFDGGVRALEKQDFEAAFREFHRSAELGDPTAQSLIGALYEDGRAGGPEPRPRPHLVPEGRGARGAGAQFALGRLYRNGEGVLQDYTETRSWYLLPAATPTSATRRAFRLS